MENRYVCQTTAIQVSTVAEEKYVFKPETKRWLLIVLAAGILLTALGLFMAMQGGHESHGGSEGHATAVAESMVASTTAVPPQHEEGIAEEHHGSPTWLKRLYADLWFNNIIFIGLGLIGLFFVAVQFAAAVGWSAGMKRVPLAMGSWLPIAAVLTLAMWFLMKADLFHWTHADLYEKGGADYDKILDGKSGYFYWPGEAGGFPIFYIARMLVFFAMWYIFLVWIRREMRAEDLDADKKHWYKARRFSTFFIIFFAISSSVASWDWIMSIDPHWFSTMNGWYTFASWWVTGLASITLLVLFLKGQGYLKVVNSNHLHDLGKFVFAFSIFWTYIWFGQFLLIYYANMPEETVYFINRMHTAPYSWIFYLTLIFNFVLPFLMFMTRDSKRHTSTLKVVCSVVLIGHWFDFYNMVSPGVVKEAGTVGFLEVGVTLIFVAAFLWVTLQSLSRMPLIGRNHPMLEESLHHHI